MKVARSVLRREKCCKALFLSDKPVVANTGEGQNFTEIPEHMDDHDVSFCEDLLPWSDKLPGKCRKA